MVSRMMAPTHVLAQSLVQVPTRLMTLIHVMVPTHVKALIHVMGPSLVMVYLWRASSGKTKTVDKCTPFTSIIFMSAFGENLSPKMPKCYAKTYRAWLRVGSRFGDFCFCCCLPLLPDSQVSSCRCWVCWAFPHTHIVLSRISFSLQNTTDCSETRARVCVIEIRYD